MLAGFQVGRFSRWQVSSWQVFEVAGSQAGFQAFELANYFRFRARVSMSINVLWRTPALIFIKPGSL
jgi:hypothetical protein